VGGGGDGAATPTGGGWPGVVSFAFDAENDDELSVAAGDAVTVVAEVDGWLHVARGRDGARGLVPASYVGRAG
jgi:hypothetical protein